MPINRAQDMDSHVIADILVKSWQAAYRGIMPADRLNNLSVEQFAQGWQRHLASGAEAYLMRVADETIGVVEICPLRNPLDGFGDCGEIPVLYLKPAFFGQGYGRALMDFAQAALQNQGFGRTCLWVLQKNKKATNFYFKYGFQRTDYTKIHQSTGLVEVFLFIDSQ
jgi:GNAT superfamily N-acetyltransferase